MSRSQPDNSGRDMGTLSALLGLLVVAGLLIFLVALVLPQVLGIFLVVLGFGGTFVLHYLVWGRWMSQLAPPEEAPAVTEKHRS